MPLTITKRNGIYRIRANCYFGVAMAAVMCDSEIVIVVPNVAKLQEVWETLDADPLEHSLVENVIMCGVNQAIELPEADLEAEEDEAPEIEVDPFHELLVDLSLRLSCPLNFDAMKRRLDWLLEIEVKLEELKKKHFLLVLENIELKADNQS